MKKLYHAEKIIPITFDLHKEKVDLLSRCVKGFDIDLSKPFNVQFVEKKLSKAEVDNIALQCRRADGKYIYKGEFIRWDKLSELILKDYIKVKLYLTDVEEITSPVIRWEN